MGEYPRVSGVITQGGQDISDLCNEVADLHGCPPRLIVACAVMESNLDEQSERRAVWPDVSAGLFHQTVRWAAGFGLGDGSDSPENIEYVFHTLKTDLTWAARIAASQLGHWWGREDEGLNALSRYNSPGLAWVENPNKANIARGWAESARYVVEEAPVARIYDPDTSAERQQQDWTCSVRTATWLLRSLGIDMTAAPMQDLMVAANLVSPAVGLHDGSGRALAAWLSAAFNLTVHVETDIPWERACELAGTVPLALGSAALYHWLAVRRPAEDDLALMNPAPGYLGVGDWMDRATFQHWAPWNALWVEVEAAPEEEDDMSRVAELETILGEMQRIARDELIINLEDALAVQRLPALAREKIAAGALPAAHTIARLGAPEGDG